VDSAPIIPRDLDAVLRERGARLDSPQGSRPDSPDLRARTIRRAYKALANQETRHGAAIALGRVSVNEDVEAVLSCGVEVFTAIANASNQNRDRVLDASEVENAIRYGHDSSRQKGLRGDSEVGPVPMLSSTSLQLCRRRLTSSRTCCRPKACPASWVPRASANRLSRSL
jgi:hypothetical protein